MINSSTTPEQLPLHPSELAEPEAFTSPWPADAEFHEATVGNDHYTFVYDAGGLLIDAWRVTIGAAAA